MKIKRPKKDILLQKSFLKKYELWWCKKGFPYEVRMVGINEPVMGHTFIDEAKESMDNLEWGMFGWERKLKLHEMGVIKLTKKQRIKLIFKEFKDNFDRIKKLKEYGVIK